MYSAYWPVYRLQFCPLFLAWFPVFRVIYLHTKCDSAEVGEPTLRPGEGEGRGGRVDPCLALPTSCFHSVMCIIFTNSTQKDPSKDFITSAAERKGSCSPHYISRSRDPPPATPVESTPTIHSLFIDRPTVLLFLICSLRKTGDHATGAS